MNPDPIFAQIRANIAFEHMLMAVLIAAAASGGAVFLLAGGEAIISSRQIVPALFGAFYSAMVFSFVAFLIGFFASVAVGLPLFLALEKIRLRKAWPYIAAGAAIELVAAGFVLKRMPMVEDFLSLDHAPLLLPGILAAAIFGRRMGPVWKAAEREAAPFAPGGPTLLH
jgi:hypothetical protein